MIKIKSFKNIKSKSGISLTELLVGMVLLSIFILTVGALLTNVTRLQRRVIEMTELNALVDNVSNPIIRELTNTSALLVFCDDDCECNAGCVPASPGVARDCAVTPVSDCPCACRRWGDGNDRFTMFVHGQHGSVTYSISDDGVLVRSCNSPQCAEVCDPLTCDPPCDCAVFDPACTLVHDCPGHNCVIGEHPVLSKAFYKGRSASFELVRLPPPVTGVAYILTVTIILDENGAELTMRDYAVRPLSLNQY